MDKFGNEKKTSFRQKPEKKKYSVNSGTNHSVKKVKIHKSTTYYCVELVVGSMLLSILSMCPYINELSILFSIAWVSAIHIRCTHDSFISWQNIRIQRDRFEISIVINQIERKKCSKNADFLQGRDQPNWMGSSRSISKFNSCRLGSLWSGVVSVY